MEETQNSICSPILKHDNNIIQLNESILKIQQLVRNFILIYDQGKYP